MLLLCLYMYHKDIKIINLLINICICGIWNIAVFFFLCLANVGRNFLISLAIWKSFQGLPPICIFFLLSFSWVKQTLQGHVLVHAICYLLLLFAIWFACQYNMIWLGFLLNGLVDKYMLSYVFLQLKACEVLLVLNDVRNSNSYLLSLRIFF